MKSSIALIVCCSFGLISALPLDLQSGSSERTESSIQSLNELFNAIKSGNIDRVKELANDQIINSSVENGRRALHLAAEIGDGEIVDLLIQKGADVNAVNEEGLSPLHFAALNNDETVTNLLIKHGANVNKPDKFGYTPVFLAALNSNEKIIETLLKNGVNINEFVTKDTTILHFAAVNMNEKVIELLINKGANVNLVNKLNQTPLHIAALNSNEKLADLLIKSGANVNALDKNEREALQHTVYNGNDKSKAETIETTTQQKSYTKRKCYEELLKHYTNPIHKDAAKKIAELLIKNGAKINQRDSAGKTAYDEAISYDNIKMKEFLVKYKGESAKKSSQ